MSLLSINVALGRAIVLIGLLLAPVARVAAQDEPAVRPRLKELRGRDAPLVLLVNGIALDLGVRPMVWGERSELEEASKWNGLIGRLEIEGLRFGGVVEPRGGEIKLPECLTDCASTIDARQADVFQLNYSPAAAADGLAYKTLELASCLDELKRFTGRSRATVVAHSAGGLVTRAYVQSALPGVHFKHDIDRLITIGTPHLGSVEATEWGNLLGLRATSLAHDAELLKRLNHDLKLPEDVRFCSIVVRGFSADTLDIRNEGAEYVRHLDPALFGQLPVDFQMGGDQVVHVRSQNLGLATSARDYETAHQRPIFTPVIRVEDPSPLDHWLRLEKTVHEAEVYHPAVMDRVVHFLGLSSKDWERGATSDRALAELDFQWLLKGLAELKVFQFDPQHPINSGVWREVQRVDLQKIEFKLGDPVPGNKQVIACEAAVQHVWRISKGAKVVVTGDPNVTVVTTPVRFEVQLEYDRFQRPVVCVCKYAE